MTGTQPQTLDTEKEIGESLTNSTQKKNRGCYGKKHDHLRVVKTALETRYSVLEDMYERMRADSVSVLVECATSEGDEVKLFS